MKEEKQTYLSREKSSQDGKIAERRRGLKTKDGVVQMQRQQGSTLRCNQAERKANGEGGERVTKKEKRKKEKSKKAKWNRFFFGLEDQM